MIIKKLLTHALFTSLFFFSTNLQLDGMKDQQSFQTKRYELYPQKVLRIKSELLNNNKNYRQLFDLLPPANWIELRNESNNLFLTQLICIAHLLDDTEYAQIITFVNFSIDYLVEHYPEMLNHNSVLWEPDSEGEDIIHHAAKRFINSTTQRLIAIKKYVNNRAGFREYFFAYQKYKTLTEKINADPAATGITTKRSKESLQAEQKALQKFFENKCKKPIPME